jgi:hypothetical protein
MEENQRIISELFDKGSSPPVSRSASSSSLDELVSQELLAREAGPEERHRSLEAYVAKSKALAEEISQELARPIKLVPVPKLKHEDNKSFVELLEAPPKRGNGNVPRRSRFRMVTRRSFDRTRSEEKEDVDLKEESREVATNTVAEKRLDRPEKDVKEFRIRKNANDEGRRLLNFFLENSAAKAVQASGFRSSAERDINLQTKKPRDGITESFKQSADSKWNAGNEDGEENQCPLQIECLQMYQFMSDDSGGMTEIFVDENLSFLLDGSAVVEGAITEGVSGNELEEQVVRDEEDLEGFDEAGIEKYETNAGALIKGERMDELREKNLNIDGIFGDVLQERRIVTRGEEERERVDGDNQENRRKRGNANLPGIPEGNGKSNDLEEGLKIDTNEVSGELKSDETDGAGLNLTANETVEKSFVGAEILQVGASPEGEIETWEEGTAPFVSDDKISHSSRDEAYQGLLEEEGIEGIEIPEALTAMGFLFLDEEEDL